MYPESFLWWLGGILLLIGVLGLIGMLAFWVDHKAKQHMEKHTPEEDE